jgi:hypothetical protein
VSDETPKKSVPLDRWFIGNLAAFIVLAVLSTAWFTLHFEAYFTQVILVGGVFTAWALVRLVWSLVLHGTDFEAKDFSRRLLSSPGMTRLLILATAFMVFLWFTTASLYFEFAGEGSDVYRVQVVRADSRQNYGEPFESSASQPLNGVFRLLQFGPMPLRCSIISPIGRQPADCSLLRGKSVHLKVPTGFPEKEYHLLQLMSDGSLYRRLPRVGAEARSAFSLEVVVMRDGAQLARGTRDDLRKQTLNLLPTDPDERSLVARLADARKHEAEVLTRFAADGVGSEGAGQAAAVLTTNVAAWELAYLRAGDRVIVTVVKRVQVSETDPVDETRSMIDYEVTDSQVQTIWLKE